MSTSSTPTPTCPLCNQPAETGTTAEWVIQFRCKRCGRFDLHIDALAGIRQDQRYLLSAAIRNRIGAEVVTISQANVETLMQQAPKFGVSETLNQILELAAQRTTDGIGSFSALNIMTDYPLVAARSSAEMSNLVGALKSRGLLIQHANLITLTVQGWERLEEIRRTGRSSALVFVAMWFDKSTEALYDQAIKPAVREAGYEPLRIDQHEHVNRIDDEIIGQVRRSRFMVADFTGQRHGVYFEAGFIMGLGRNVIWMCDKKDLSHLHFDVRQYSFIDWESVEDAHIRLLRRIRSLEGEGPNVQ